MSFRRGRANSGYDSGIGERDMGVGIGFTGGDLEGAGGGTAGQGEGSFGNTTRHARSSLLASLRNANKREHGDRESLMNVLWDNEEALDGGDASPPVQRTPSESPSLNQTGRSYSQNSPRALRRAGLLQPKSSPSYTSSGNPSTPPSQGYEQYGHPNEPVAHSARSIRISTLQLSNMLLSARHEYGSLPVIPPHRLNTGRRFSANTGTRADSFIFPTPNTTPPSISTSTALPPLSRTTVHTSAAPTLAPVTPGQDTTAAGLHSTLSGSTNPSLSLRTPTPQSAEVLPSSASTSTSTRTSTLAVTSGTHPTSGLACGIVPENPSRLERVPHSHSHLYESISSSSSLSSLELSTSTESSDPRISYPLSSSRNGGYPSTLSFFDSEGSDREDDVHGSEDVGRTPTQHQVALPHSHAHSTSPNKSHRPSALSLMLRSHSAEREGEHNLTLTADERAMEGYERGGGGSKVNESTKTPLPAITLSPPSANPELGGFHTSSFNSNARLSNEATLDARSSQDGIMDERVPLFHRGNYIANGHGASYESVAIARSPSHSHSPSSKKSSHPFSQLSSYLKNGLNQGFRETFRKETFRLAVKALPGVLLGCLLNVLDGVSYGMIIFPSSPPFSTHHAATLGVSMFFVSCFIAQMVYTLGGSGFKGANGSMMIEVVPFFHILATSIAEQIGEDKPREVIATTLVAYALSSVLTGLAFFLLGALRLGVIIGFFPRHILVGCIGGVGAFLILTGLTVSTRLPDDDFAFDAETFKFFFMNSHNLMMWTIPLALAILLRLVTARWRGDMVFPAYFLVVPSLFYTIVLAARLDLDTLRHAGWLFDVGAGAGDGMKWYSFYAYFDYHLVHFSPLWNTLPTQFALLFFNILHPPLNVPALSVSLNEDIDTNKELVGHGYSNLLAGLVGTVPNYLVYVNTLLFYRVGGNTRIAGFLLAVATAALLFIGTGPIAFIPVMVVGALIFVLGLDLVKEALWDARHRASRTEYITIVSIMVCMTVWDFVIGVLFGIVMSCFFFVVQNSQVPSIRALRSGETAMSSVRRPSSQRDYLREVSKQTSVMHLQGFLFFGTIVSVEDCIRDLIEGASWQRNPVRFLVLDLSLVAGIDMSAAEAFVRVHRLVITKHVILVFCGFGANGVIGQALEAVEVLGADGVELFETLNDALEWTENAYLRAWFRSHKNELSIHALPGRREADVLVAQSFGTSPRFSHLHDVGNRTMANDSQPLFGDDFNGYEYAEPFDALVKAFSSYGEISLEQFRPLLSYLQRISVPEGHILWTQNDAPDGVYIIQSGVLRAAYDFSKHTPTLEESMVAGTLAGELTALSDSPRNATVMAERQSVLWRLSMPDLRQLEKEHPALFWNFCQMVLKVAKVDYDILLSSIATRT